MKGTVLGTFAVTIATAVALSAQATPPPAEQTQPAGASAKNKITVSGCLERSKDSASPTGTSGAASGAAMDSSKFVLNNVTPGATAGTSGSASIASSYKLDGDDSKLTPHIGHKVEITGNVDERASASPGGAKLKVDSVKMVAASCSAQ